MFSDQGSFLSGGDALKKLWYAKTLRDVYETWRPLDRYVTVNYKKFTGQKPGNILDDNFVK